MEIPKASVLTPFRRAGYRHGLRQPSQSISVHLLPPPSDDHAALDRWLKATFSIEVSPLLAEPGTDQRCAAFAWRILHLAMALLRSVRVPALVAGRITATAPPNAANGHWVVTAAVPKVDLMPARAYMEAYQTATSVLNRLAARTHAPAEIDALLDQVHSTYIKPMQGIVPGAASSVPVMRAAFEMGIPSRHLGSGAYQLGWGSASRRFERGAVQFDSAIGARIAQDKHATATLLHDAGLPAPVHMLVAGEVAALSAAHALGWPVVVKPVDRDRGEGVTVEVDDDGKLAEAFAKARKLSRRVLVERQVAGVCHRVIVAAGKAMLVSRRLPKGVWGDGESTVAQMVEQENAKERVRAPWDRLKPFLLDEAADHWLAASNFTRDSVPAKGAFAPLRRIESSHDGGVVDFFTDTIHPENADVCIRAAGMFGLALAGIDMISPDITRPWHENGAIVNEVNYSSLLPSRTAYHVLPQILRRLVEGDARIPVEVVIGEGAGALQEAAQRQAAYVARGVRCHLATASDSRGPHGEPVPFAGTGLFGRCNALSVDDRVDAIVAVVQSDEWLATGSPFDRIVGLAVAAGERAPWAEETRVLLAPYLAAESM